MIKRFGLTLCTLVLLSQPAWVVAEPSRLVRGGQLFQNYCAGCHSLKRITAQRLTLDLSLPWPSKSAHQPLRVSLPSDEARRWFGQVPPDLSLVARQRGHAWLRAYLQGFYPDDQRPFGSNNHQWPQVAMPNVLGPLQQQLSAEQFTVSVNDLVAFLDYVAEPAQVQRRRLAPFVLAFLAVFLLVAWLCFRSISTKA